MPLVFWSFDVKCLGSWLSKFGNCAWPVKHCPEQSGSWVLTPHLKMEFQVRFMQAFRCLAIALANNSNHQSFCSATIWCQGPDILCVSPGIFSGCLYLSAMEHQPDSVFERCEVPNSKRGFGTCDLKWRKAPPCMAGGTSDTDWLLIW